jgi:predicted MFS family arabinose efflux permease
LLASAPNLTIFTLLRIVQGLCMASAFTLTLAYLGENTSPGETASVFAAYITGNVGSNLIGRLLSAGVADHFGLSWNFYFFALLNLCGAVLVYFTVHKAPPMTDMGTQARSPFAAWVTHLKNPALRAAFGIAFCILFAFIGTFTYVNFVLVGEPFSVGGMMLGFVYLVFLPSILTTPLAGRAVQWLGTRPTMWSSLALAVLGLPLMLTPSLTAVLIGMVLVGVGTFFAQATATGFVGACGHGRSRRRERHLSRLLLRRRPDRQRCARPVLRQVRLARLRRRNCGVTPGRHSPDVLADP